MSTKQQAVEGACGKHGCGKPAKHTVRGSLTYRCCDEHLQQITMLCESEDRLNPAAVREYRKVAKKGRE